MVIDRSWSSWSAAIGQNGRREWWAGLTHRAGVGLTKLLFVPKEPSQKIMVSLVMAVVLWLGQTVLFGEAGWPNERDPRVIARAWPFAIGASRLGFFASLPFIVKKSTMDTRC